MAGISFDEFVNGKSTKKNGGSSKGITTTDFVNSNFKKKSQIDFSQYDQDILGTLKQDKSTWTYDLFDAEDMQRKAQGLMPKSLADDYDLDDPIDKALYEGGYVSRNSFSKGYQQAEKNNATKANFDTDIVKSVQTKLASDPEKNEKQAFEEAFDELRKTDAYKNVVKSDDKDAFFKRYAKGSMQSSISKISDEDLLKEMTARATLGDSTGLGSVSMPQAGNTYTAGRLQNMQDKQTYSTKIDRVTDEGIAEAGEKAKAKQREEKADILKYSAMYNEDSEARADEIDKRIKEINRTLNRSQGVQQTYINPENRNALLQERNALQAEADALRNERSKIVAGRNASKMADFYKVPTMEGFAELSQYDPARAKTEDALYNFINGQQVVTPGISQIGVNMPASTSDPDYAFKYLTDEERGIYNYLVNTGADDEAFLEAVRPYANKRMREAVEAEAAAYAEDRPMLSSLETIVTSPISAIEGLVGLGKTGINAIKGQDTDPNDPIFQNTRKNAAIRDTVANTIKSENQGFIGEALSMLYQTGMSMGDTAIRLPMGAAGLGVAGLSAAASAMDDALSRGASSGQALASGMLMGAAEVVFEKVSLDNLVNVSRAGNGVEIIKNILKQGSVEASEEALTEIANTISDAVVMTDRSAYETAIREYMAQGADEATARYMASMDTFGQILAAAAGGLISGAGFGAGGSVYSTAQTAAIGANLDAKSQIEQGLAMPKDTDAYKIASRLSTNGNATAAQVGEQFIANQEAIAAGARAEFESNVRASGISADSVERAIYLYDRIANGKATSPKATKALAKLQEAVNAANAKRSEVEAELGVTRLEIKTKLEQTYAAMTEAMERGDMSAFNKAKARYMADYQIAQAKTSVAQMKADNQNAEAVRKTQETVNEMVAETVAEDMAAQEKARKRVTFAPINTEEANGNQNYSVPQRNAGEQRTRQSTGNETARIAEPAARSEEGTGRNQRTDARTRRGLVSTPEAEAAIETHKEVVKRATGADITARIVNEVSEADAEMLDAIKNITGRDAFLYESDDSYGDGFAKDGQIFLRVNGSSHLAFLSGHEAAHADSKLTEAGMRVIENMAKSELESYAEARKAEVGEDGADIERELISDMFGRMMFEVATGHKPEKDFGVSRYTIDRFYDAFLQALSPDLETGGYVGEAARAAADAMNVGEAEYSRTGDTGGKYSYNNLVAQEPMKVVNVPDFNAIFHDKQVKRGRIIELGLENAAKRAEGFDAQGVPYVTNKYTGKELRISRASIKHGLDGGFTRFSVNSRLGLVIGELAENAIPVNRLRPKNKLAEKTYAMVAYGRSADEDFVAILHVDETTEKVEDVEILVDRVHSLNGRIKKNTTDSTSQIDSGESHTGGSAPTISIRDLLDIVKELNPGVLSRDVLEQYGINKGTGGYYDGETLYSRITFSDPDAYVDKDGKVMEYSYTVPEVKQRALPKVKGKTLDLNDHIDRRDAQAIANRNVAPFQEEYPQLKPYMQEMAAIFMDDLQNSTRAERFPIYDGDVYRYITGWTGVKRSTTKEIEELLDAGHMTYDRIEKALDKILLGEDLSGADVKRVEIQLDHALTEGHKSRTGEFNTAPNVDYIAEKAIIPGALPNSTLSTEDIDMIQGAVMHDADVPTEYYANFTKKGEKYTVTGETEEEVIRKAMEILHEGGKYYADVTIKGETVRMSGNDKAALEAEIREIKQKERMEQISRPVQILREANRLFKSGIGVENYNELCRRTGQEYDVAVARALMGMQLRNGQEVGGQLSTAHLNEILADSDEWKDKGAFAYGRETIVRNLEDIAPTKEKGRELVDTYWRPIDQGVADMTRWMRKWSDTIGALSLDAEESAMVQLVGEGRVEGKVLNEGLMREDGTMMDTGKIQRAVNTFRKFYAEALALANDALARNGYAPVHARPNYFPHIDELTSDWQSFVNDVVRGGAEALPTEISGMTEIFQPGKKWFRNFQQRLGEETAYDAVRGFQNYISGIGQVIFLTDGIQRIRQLEKAIRTKYGMADGNETLEKSDLTGKEKTQHLSRFAAWLLEYGNQLAGKTTRVDRAIEDALGRKGLTVLKWMKNRFGANAVGGNLSTALSNFIPLTQGLATMQKRAFVNGMRAALSRQVRNDGLWEHSNFLTKRFGKPDALTVQHWKLGWNPKNIKIKGSIEAQKASKALGWLFETVDRFSAETLVFGKYQEGVQQGLDAAEAMRRADEYAERTMAGRTIGSVPTLLNSKTLGLFTQFQLEVNNQMSNLVKDMPRQYGDRKKLIFALLQLLIYSFLYNEINEKFLTGRRPAFDPIDVVVEAVSDFADPEVKKGDALVNLGTNVLDQLPLGQLLTGGGRIPLAGAVESASPIEAVRKSLNGDEGAGEAWKDFASGILYNFALPAGGGQVKKMVTGVKSLAEGGRYYGDQLAYPVKPTAGNIVSSVLLGPSAAKGGRKYYSEGGQPLTKKKTAAYETVVDAGVDPAKAYETLQNYGGDTDAAKLTSLAEADVDEKTRKLIANAMGLSLGEGTIKSQAKAEAKEYLAGKEKQYKSGKITKADLEAEDRKTQGLISRLMGIK